MEYKVLDNGQVLKVEQVGDSYQATHYKMTRATVINDLGGVISISLKSWDDMPLEYISVPVIISGDQIDTVETLCTDGTLTLTGPSGAVVKIETKLTDTDNSKVEVVLP